MCAFLSTLTDVSVSPDGKVSTLAALSPIITGRTTGEVADGVPCDAADGNSSRSISASMNSVVGLGKNVV